LWKIKNLQLPLVIAGNSSNQLLRPHSSKWGNLSKNRNQNSPHRKQGGFHEGNGGSHGNRLANAVPEDFLQHLPPRFHTWRNGTLRGRNPHSKCNSCGPWWETEKVAGSQVSSLLLPGRALLAWTNQDPFWAAGLLKQRILGSGEGIGIAASKPKNVFYFEVVLWIFPNPAC
jgi:hypothetical protein